MHRFTISDEFAGTRFAFGGRQYEFDGTELVVEDLADAKRIRGFAEEQPQWGISDDEGEIGTVPVNSGEIVADPATAADGDDAPTGDDATTSTEDTDTADASADQTPAASVESTDEPVDTTASAEEVAAEVNLVSADETDEPKPISRMNRDELAAVAAERGIDTEGLTKAQIRSALEG